MNPLQKDWGGVRVKNSRYFNPDLPESLTYPNVPVGAILKGSASHYSDRTAYIYQGEGMTFKTLYEKSLRFANALRGLGVKKGTVVATHLPTCPQYIITYYGIILAGAIYSPTNPALPSDELIYQLKDCGAAIVVTHEKYANLLKPILKQTEIDKVILTGDQEMFTTESPVKVSVYEKAWHSLADLINKSSKEEINTGIDPEKDIIHIAYTGGTTGKPKGVVITHANLISNVLQSAAWSSACLAHVEDGALTVAPVEKDPDKYLAEYPTLPGTGIRISPAPLFHGAGVIGSIVYPVLFGTTTILIDRFDPGQFLEDVERYRVTELSGAPPMFNFLLRHPDMEKRDFSAVRIINSGAAPIVVELMKMLQQSFPNALITEGYGLTEATATAVCSVSFRSGRRKLGTVGLPVYDTEVKLIALDGSSEEPLSPGQSGEVCIRGPQVTSGYYNQPEETEQTIRNGWLRTGDIGVFDEDGFLSIIDRKKEMLIYNGYNVYPRKLEELLFEHPDIANAAVIGKPVRDKGEIPKAFITLKPGATVTEEEIIEYINSRVIHYMKIRELELVDELPMTAAGKILKRALRDREVDKEKELNNI
ncbi:hypothetical protein B1A98_10460 [Bacillus badius]|nr:hypothetical protein A6M11_16390 [Bacillus badius]OVE51960.1 hypothetical protein B1A98_10460 [Bacillus badius]TDW03396.1 long-chain acyl-CoA synthetase [Bacillus badius]